jgi:EmrB/QacA subfamily drug resistance transporter
MRLSVEAQTSQEKQTASQELSNTGKIGFVLLRQQMLKFMQNKNDLTEKQVPLTMAGLMLCLLLSALDNSIVSTAMPQIIRDLNGMAHYSLPFTSYLLFSTIVIPIAGKLSDVFGRKIVMIWGIWLFMGASLLCAASWNMTALILFRGLQGACGGVLASSAFIITSELFPPKERGKKIGILASMHGLASLLGPLTGGLITDCLSWHWIFFINLPVGLVALILLKKHLSLMKHSEHTTGLDLKGILVFLLAIFPFLFCLAEGGKLLSWGSPVMLGLMLFSLVMFVVFTRIEKYSHSPLLPTGLLKNPVFSHSAFSAAMAYIAMFGLILYVPFLLQIVQKKGATYSGMVMLPMSISMVAGGMIGGALISRFQQFRKSGSINFLIAITGMSLLLFFSSSITTPMLILCVLLTGLGIGMNFPIINLAPQAVFPAAQLGIVISTLEFFQVMGGVLSTSVSGTLIHSSMNGVIVFNILALLTGLISMITLNEKKVHEGFAKQRSLRQN